MLNRKFAKSTVSKFLRFKRHLPKPARGFLAGLGLIILTLVSYNLLFWGRIYPGVTVSGIIVSGKKPDEAARLLSDKTTPVQIILLQAQTESFEIPLEDINFSYDYAGSAERAYNLDRSGNTLFDIFARAKAPTRKVNLGLRIELDEDKLSEHLSVVAGQLAVEPIFPSAELSGGQIIINPGKPGVNVDVRALRVLIGKNLAFASNAPIKIPTKTLDPRLTKTEVASYKLRAEKFLGKTLSLKFEEQVFSYDTSEIIKLIDPLGEYDQEAVQELARSLAKKINRSPQNPVLVFRGNRVKEFAPAKDGIEVKLPLLKEMIVGNLRTLEETDKKTVSVDLPTEKTAPAIKTGDINNLGINELIGKGSSRFAGSVSSRIYNISLAASRLNGILIKPGQTFSFNNALGDVSKLTGYKEAFIIKDGKTILGDGGGVCQVSTTFFRAGLSSGLPIIERRAHSYRVAYYEQDAAPGFDATVYAPTTDLKIKNDTPAHILIQAYTDTKNYTLVFEFYGTSDGRVATTTKPVVTDLVAPPEDFYQDDPALPVGTIKQIDWKAWGARARFNYKVTRNGELVYQKTFYSNFRPWQAKFLRGTGPAQ
jgi:vancomycin resistance protein YoaR